MYIITLIEIIGVSVYNVNHELTFTAFNWIYDQRINTTPISFEDEREDDVNHSKLVWINVIRFIFCVLWKS